MMRLYWCEIAGGLPLPPFGGEFSAHMQAKKHPRGRAASLSAWSLLALALREAGFSSLPQIAFAPGGKPFFVDSPLHFSISHSGNLAAAILGDSPCAVDVERMRPELAQRLSERCLSPQEAGAGCDFFDIWTKKECIAKLDGSGMRAHPCALNTLDPQYSGRFFSARLVDEAGEHYALSALCEDIACLKPEKRSVI